MKLFPAFLVQKNLVERYGSIAGKRIAILRNIIVMTVLAGLVFIILELVEPTGTPLWVYSIVFIISIYSLFLLGNGKSRQATLLFISFLNFILFIEMSSESIRTGFHLHFITLGFGTIVLLGHEERRLALMFVLGSGILYILAFLGIISFLTYRPYSEDWTKILFVVNFLIFVAMIWYLVGLVMKLNYKSETALSVTNEQAQAQNQLLIKTNEELDFFVYRAANDLRAPLNSISGLVNLAEKDSFKNEYYERMKDQIALMERFIKEIIDISINSRKPIEIEPIMLRAKIENIISSMNYMAHINQLNIEIDVNSNLIVSSDKTRLRVILSNLLSNAIQFADLSKDAPSIKVVAKVVDDGVEIRIIDNGIGIPNEYQAKIFDMFYRASDRSKGTGLGLYVAKETIKRLNGVIQFRSTPGEGSEFSLQLIQEKGNLVDHE